MKAINSTRLGSSFVIRRGFVFGAQLISFATVVFALWAVTPIADMLIGGSSASGTASAQNNDEERETRRTPAMRERTYKKLSEAQEEIDEGNSQGALEILNDLKADDGLNSYERAMTWNFTAFLHSNNEDYRQAIRAFEQVLKQPEIPLGLEQQTIFSMAQMYLAVEQPSQTIRMLKRWFSISEPNTQAYILWAQACFLSDDYRCAAQNVEKAIALNNKQGGGQPKENWLLMLRAAYYELGNVPKAIDALEQLVEFYPKGDYFYQLSGMYGEQGNEEKQLSVLEASYDAGMFSRQGEYVALGSLLLNADVPYKAAKVLQEGMDKGIVEKSVTHLRMLAQAWQYSQEAEESISVLQQAAKKSDEGELYVRLGQSYMNLDEWDNCVRSIRAGFKKGGVQRHGSALISLGICLYNADDLDGAIEVFKSAAKNKDSAKFAKNWIEFLRKEKSRRSSIEESLS